MNKIFIIEKGPGNFIVKLNKDEKGRVQILNSKLIIPSLPCTTWDKEEDAIRACVLANQAFDLAKKFGWNSNVLSV